MAVTMSLYNHVPKLFANGDITKTTLKVELLSNTATFTATHTAKTSVDNGGSYEVYGNGWPQGGPTIGSVAVTQVAISDGTVDDAKIAGNDVIVTATGGLIGPAYKALIYDATSNYPIIFVDFGGGQSAGDTTDFKVRFNALGFINWTK
jgi:hypothetical protein